VIDEFYRPAVAGDKIDFIIFAVACRILAEQALEEKNVLVAAVGYRLAEIGYSKYPNLRRSAALMRSKSVLALNGQEDWVLAIDLDLNGGVE